MIIVRRTATVPKTALAGVMLEIFSARSMASMAAFNVETAPSRPVGRWDFVAMVETARRRCSVRKNPNPDRDERPSCHESPASCEQSHSVKRIVFTIVDFEDARDGGEVK